MVRLCIKEVAAERHFNQKQIREAAHITTTQFGKLWHNQFRRGVDLEALSRIARVLGVRTRDLIVDDEAG